MYHVISKTDAGECLEGRRRTLRTAYALGRKLWREYRETAQIIVRTEDGDTVASDVSDFTVRGLAAKGAAYRRQTP